MRYLVLLFAVLAALAPMSWSRAQNLLTGEREVGQSLVEPAYEDMTGNLIYLLTPIHAPFPVNANEQAWEPIYIVVYPTSSAGSVGVLNCMHRPQDNCPDHGPEVAAAAAGIEPAVYGGGVLGHDHILHAPGPPGGAFNVNWEIHLVLFTNAAAARTHITTLAQLQAAKARGDVIDIDTDTAFACAVVPATVYAQGSPVTPVTPPPTGP
jgi:hypothetical protein